MDPTALLRRSQNDVDDLAATEGPQQLGICFLHALLVVMLSFIIKLEGCYG